MPPKVKVTKEDVVLAAMEIVRREGVAAINARTIAAGLGCSTQPIFSNFATMEELKSAVLAQAEALCNQYIQTEVESGKYPVYKASGMAYIRFAKEESALFQLLFMRDRGGETEGGADNLFTCMVTVVQGNTGLDFTDAQVFHLEMWAYVHGIATMMATGFFLPDWELVSRMLSDAYLGLRKHYGMEG
jgi:AcrR family transcriptional regulator